MEFTDVLFLFFILPLFLITYNFSPTRGRNHIILMSSFFILMWKSLSLFFILICCSFFNYFASCIIYRLNKNKIRLFLFVMLILVNFVVLVAFLMKDEFYYYSNFFKGNIFKKLYLYLFFMNNMSYLADIYKNRVSFSKNILNYFIYVFMFFKFFIGPVVPYHKIKNNIEKRNVEFKHVVAGIEQFVYGLFKVSFFSYETGQIVRFVVLKSFEELSFCAAWIGAAAMFFNIYFYFFGYCDMATGLGKIAGFCFPKNFSDVIFLSSLKKFFKNFNITFTNYFKFYVFPWALEKGKMFQIFKYLIVMVLYIICFDQFYSIIYFFILIFVERFFLGKHLKKIPITIKKILSFVLILIGVSMIYQNSGLEILKYLKILFGGSGIFFDRSLVFIIIFLRFFGVVTLFFVINILMGFLKKPKRKYENVYLCLKYILFVVIFLVSIAYCLTV